MYCDKMTVCELYLGPFVSSLLIHFFSRDTIFPCVYAFNNAYYFLQLHTQFTDVTAGTAFDVLMDQDYRSNWDDASITDFDICKLDGSNDIGYYASKYDILLTQTIP